MLIVKDFVFSPIQENTYVLYNEARESVFIDPGCYFGNERNELKSFIDDHQLLPKSLLNTHCHLDHVFGNKFVHDTWKLVPHIHPKEKQMLDLAPLSGLNWNLPFDGYTGELKYVTEGTVIRLGEDELKVIETPGHSPGHVCFYCEKQGFLIGGDLLFRQSIGRTDLPGGDYDTLMKSIRDKIFVLPGETLVYSGHGPTTTVGFEKENNPFFKAWV